MEWTKERLDKLTSELKTASIENDETYCDGAAYDIAQSVLFDNEGLKEYLISIGITDVIGYLAEFV